MAATEAVYPRVEPVGRHKDAVRHSHPWLKRFSPVANPRLTLFCFPHAGAGAAAYLAWARFFARHAVEVCAVQLPGRAGRINDPMPGAWPDLINAVSHEVAAACRGPYGLFGHSMGGLLAYELARTLSRPPVGLPPECLILSGTRAAGQQHAPVAIHHLPDHEFVAAFEKHYGALPAAVKDNSEILQFVLPTLKSDLRLVETYVHSPSAPLDIPLLAYSGCQDHLAPPDGMADWRDYTTRTFRQRLFNDGHLFIETQREQVLGTLLDDLRFLDQDRLS